MLVAMSVAASLVNLLLKSKALAVHVPIGRASLDVVHRRLRRKGELYVYEDVAPVERVWNLITLAGRDFLHYQGYGTSVPSACGLNFIALSNDTVTETSASTVLSNEITTNGLGRVQGAVAHTIGTNTTTVLNEFTATGGQSAQKAALFTAISSGTMNHVLGFTQRTLANGDKLTLTYTITLG